MGFFNKTESSAGTLAPLSAARIKAVLEGEGLKYGVDEDGEIVAGFEDCLMFFLQRGSSGEVFYIRGLWDVSLTEAQLDAARVLCDEWNRETIWPKTYTVLSEDRQVLRVCAEMAVDYEPGVTDQQILQQIRCGIGTACNFFEKLNEAFPEQTAAQKQE